MPFRPLQQNTGGFRQLSVTPEEKTKTPLTQRLGGIANTIFGGGKIGEAIGTEIARMRATPEEREFIGEGPTRGEIFGSTLQAGALFTPVGRLSGGLTAGARALGISKGASAIGKIGSGVLAGEVFDVATNLEQGETGAGVLTPGLGTGIGGAIPGLGVAKNVTVRFAEKQAPRVINSLIKPLAKDFSYGKNPGRAVAEEGIVANNFDDLITKIRSTRQRIGQSIGELGNKLSTKPSLDIRDTLFPINEAMKEAASMNNPTLLSRLANVKRAIVETLEPAVDEAGNITIKTSGMKKLEGLTFREARDVLGDIGDMTQFTGNPSDDKLVNSALKQVYGAIKEKTINSAKQSNPQLGKEFEKLTEKYADLSSAEIAAKYRDKIVERSNLVGLSPQMAGIGTGLITLISTGGAAAPAVLAGLTGAVVDKLASTPGFKTRLAAMLSKKTTQEANTIFQKVPLLRKLFPKGSAVSPGDRLLDTKAGQKLEKGAIDYAKNPKLGMSIEDVSKTASKADDNLLSEARKYKSAEEFVNSAGKLKTPYDWNYLDEMQAAKKADQPYSHSDYSYLSKLAEKYRGKEPSEPFFRAGNIDKSSLGERLDNIYLTDNEGLAQQYSSNGSMVGEYRVLSQNPLDATDSKVLKQILGDKYNELPNSQSLKEKLIKYAKDNGYDSVRFPDSGPDGEGIAGHSLVVWNKNLVKTKSQLTDIWKKANKK